MTGEAYETSKPVVLTSETPVSFLSLGGGFGEH